MVIIITIAVAIFIGLVLFVASRTNQNTNSGLEEAKLNYECALNGTDRKAALFAGRLYYSLANNRRSLTMHDELAIANDLNTMPVEVSNQRSDQDY